ncbi:DUF2169 family type VI secretion system accessory protein [Chondromyces crocatus]|uniref:DUF2169 domain-containing protein n=1 Tax=Chondromyces crocatus TaxID=52 RepID=A0A0K1ECW1_CHOCO|nr:DUF2169 domain-containing protein [Chondromyces crocatus]AKT38532.1 uncharacterized protein CMC5_026790 [Chondromyces crocatus]
MDVVSTGPVRVASRRWPSVHGTWSLAVACKVTYALLPGVSPLASEQEGLNEDDNHWDDDPVRSVYMPGDLVPYKPCADVVLVGQGFAPNRTPVASFMVRMRVGEVDKSIEVFGERSWSPEGALVEGAQVVRASLRYERAAGGPGTWNPVGVRADGPPDPYGRILLPSLQLPGQSVGRRGEPLAPVGYGPIAPSWPTRAERIRAHYGSWDPGRWFERPLPEGFDASFFNVAPGDQQVRELRDDERIVLENLHVEHAQLSTQLPGVRPRAMAERAAGRREEIALVADTLWIDTERCVCSMVWRGRISLAHPQEAGRITVGLEEPRGTGQRGKQGDAEGSGPAAPVSQSFNQAHTVLGGGDLPPLVMPFVRQGAGDAGPTKEKGHRPFPSSAMGQTQAPPFAPLAGNGGLGGLPFSAQAASPEAPPATPRPSLVYGQMFESSGASALMGKPSGATPWPQAAVAPAVVIPPAIAVPEPPVARVSFGQRAVSENMAPSPPAVSSAASASDVAAMAATYGSQAALEVASTSPTSSGSPVSAPRREPRAPGAGHYVDLLWFDVTAPRRLRAQASFASEVREPVGQGSWLSLDDELEPQQDRDRRDVLRVLGRVPSADAEGIMRAMIEAIDEEGAMAPPLVVVAGELQLFFHEVDVLKATIAVLSPLAGADKRLSEVLDAANELVASDWRCTIYAAESMTGRLREALAPSNRSILANVDRILLEQRRYQKRTLLGEKRIRAALAVEGSQTPIPCYLPEPLEAKLPLFQRFRAVLIAEARGQQDEYETNPLALIALALGRLINMPGRR